MAEISVLRSLQATLAGEAALPAARRLHPTPSGGGETSPGSFASELSSALARVDRTMAESSTLSSQMLRGEDVELHTVALRAQEASMQFDLLLQVRNRLIQGYQEIMRLQV